MARWLLLICLVVLLGASVGGCSAPARLVTHPPAPSPAVGRTVASPTQTEIAHAPSMPLDAQAEQPSDGPTPEQSRRAQILVAAVLVLAAIVVIAATI